MLDDLAKIIADYDEQFTGWPRSTRSLAGLQSLLDRLTALEQSLTDPEPGFRADAARSRQVMQTELYCIQQAQAEGAYMTELESLHIMLHLLGLRGRRSPNPAVATALLLEARVIRRRMTAATKGVIRPLAQQMLLSAAGWVDELAARVARTPAVAPAPPHPLKARAEALGAAPGVDSDAANRLSRELARLANAVFDRDGSLSAVELAALCDELAGIHAAMWRLADVAGIPRDQTNLPVVRKMWLDMELRLERLLTAPDQQEKGSRA